MQRSSKSAWLSLFIVLVAVAAAGLAWRYVRHHRADSSLPAPGTIIHQIPAGMVSYVIYVPNSQALLSQKILAEKNPFSKSPSWELKAGHTLELLLPRLKDLPPNTKILSIPRRLPKNVVEINLSREFERIQAKPDTAVALVLDAMASTLGAVEANGKTLNNGDPVKMKVLIEGQPIHEFSEFDLSQPWTSTQSKDQTAP